MRGGPVVFGSRYIRPMIGVVAVAVSFAAAAAPASAQQRAHARVTLTVAPIAMLHAVEAPRVTQQGDDFTEFTTRVRVSSNTRYSLAVELPQGRDDIHVQVRDHDGHYRTLEGSVPVGAGSPGRASPQEVRYRVIGGAAERARPVTLNFVIAQN